MTEEKCLDVILKTIHGVYWVHDTTDTAADYKQYQ